MINIIRFRMSLPHARVIFGLLGACLLLSAWAFTPSRRSNSSTSAELIDARLQQAATRALGDRRGTIIVMDPQTGRVRAVVNPDLAFAENLPSGSTIKPFTALAALRSGVIDADFRTLCHEDYSHDQFHTTCSHPRGLPPLNPTEAIAYSCNYYFGKVGERLQASDFTATLAQFGFGKATGINAAQETAGLLRHDDWHSENAIGEGEYVRATPIQLINAYAALVNGGHLFKPRVAAAQGFVPEQQGEVAIESDQRQIILKGLRGAVRYGTAESAKLYSLPAYVFGKTGTATEINGYRSQGWFVGFVSSLSENESDEFAPENVKLAVLVFIAKGHGSDAAELARPIFDEYARATAAGGGDTATWRHGDTASDELREASPRLPLSMSPRPESVSPSPRLPFSDAIVRVHLVSENSTRTLPLEEYVRGVVAIEGSMEREPEALKALAVASRTYVLRNLGRHARDGYDFCNTTHCQRFRPLDSENDSSTAVIAAVDATRGEILRDGDNIADAYFSASCGGATANLKTLWGRSAPPYLRGVSDEYCATEAHHAWTDVISHADLLKALQTDPRTNVGHRLTGVSVVRTDASGRAELIAIDGERRLTISGWDFKIIVGRALGWNVLKSSRFEITRSGASFIFRGSGFGHGLGLCQEGAHVMASRGATYREILAKYFPSTSVRPVHILPPPLGEGRGGGLGASSPSPPTPLPRGEERASSYGEYRRQAAADLMWDDRNAATSEPGAIATGRRVNLKNEQYAKRVSGNESIWPVATAPGSDRARRTLAIENFRVNFPGSTEPKEIEALLNFLQSSRKSLLARVSTAKISVQLPTLEIFINETTGDFVGRTGLPYWAAAATRGNQIELQPLGALRRRRILETTLRHELVHTLVDILGHERAPRWLAEGLALYVAGEGPQLARYEPRRGMSIEEIDKQLGYSQSMMKPEEMRTLYAAAYGQVKRLIQKEGEASVWRRVAK
jgi:stage II sporulation protein D